MIYIYIYPIQIQRDPCHWPRPGDVTTPAARLHPTSSEPRSRAADAAPDSENEKDWG